MDKILHFDGCFEGHFVDLVGTVMARGDTGD